jgi:hypothetical protein
MKGLLVQVVLCLMCYLNLKLLLLTSLILLPNRHGRWCGIIAVELSELRYNCGVHKLMDRRA